MSHLKERSEKNCLNCNAVVHGKYCQICGQENIEPAESAWHLVTHFFKDITHFDGNFFSTLKYLIFKPGFLSGEYKAGRRASYLNPVRLYVFTSAIFFLVFFSLKEIDQDIINTTYSGKTLKQIEKLDSAGFVQFTKELNDGRQMSRAELKQYVDSADKNNGLHFTSERYKSKGEYDSLLKSGKKDHNWIERQLVYKEIETNEKYKDNQQRIMKIFEGNMMHSFPQMLFISLPLFALILKLLYFRHKTFYYTSHAIFGIHLYVFVFIMLFFIIGLQELRDYTGWNWLSLIIAMLVVTIFYYLYKSMRNFYQQRRGKTIFKYLLLNIMMLFVIMLLFVIFIFTSLLKI